MKALKKYVLTLISGFSIAILIACSKDIFNQTELATIFHIWCDAFFVVGVVMTSSGLLVFSSNEGTFDMLVYGVKSFVDLFRKTGIRKYDTFYDYRESRAGKKMQFGFMLICGLFFIAVSLAMYYFYCQYC